MRGTGWMLAGVLAGASASAAAQTPAPLPLGSVQSGSTSGNSPAEYSLVAKTAGVLTIAVQGSGDLSILVLDGDGQALPDGTVDRDLNGNEGKELASVTLPEGGTYRVRVRSTGNSSSFQMAASFLGFPLFESTSKDPDRRPATAKAAQVGRAYEDSLDPAAGDSWDWFVLKISESGTLTVLTRQIGTGDAPDLILEVYINGEFSTPAQRSDQDLQSNTANESASVQVTSGQSVHVRVSNNFSSRKAAYRLSSSLAP